MSERSEWAEPVPTKPLTHHEAYAANLAPDASIEDMKAFGGNTQPDMIEVPNWDAAGDSVESNPAVKVDYSEQKEAILERSKHLNPMQNLIEMRDFLDGVYSDAAQNKLVGSKQNIYNPDALTGQFADLVKYLNKGDNEDFDPLTTVPSAGGLRSAARAFLTDAATAEPFMQALQEKILSVENEKPERVEQVHKLSEAAIEHAQTSAPASIAELMGAEPSPAPAVESTIPNLTEMMTDPFELVDQAQAALSELQKGLEQSDITALWMYSSAKDNEIGAAEKRMSDTVFNSDLRFRYKAASDKLRAARVKAGILPPTE